MKKFLAILVAVAMLASLCVSVTAADNGLGDSSADVYIKVDDSVTIHKYSVDIEFGNMHFVYGANAVWDSELHDYVISSTDASWAPESDGGDMIKIVNHSDLPISYTTAFENVSETYGKITLDATPRAGTVEKCPVQAAVAPSVNLKVALTGEPATFTDGFVELAKVIVTIEPTT